MLWWEKNVFFKNKTKHLNNKFLSMQISQNVSLQVSGVHALSLFSSKMGLDPNTCVCVSRTETVTHTDKIVEAVLDRKPLEFYSILFLGIIAIFVIGVK